MRKPLKSPIPLVCLLILFVLALHPFVWYRWLAVTILSAVVAAGLR